MWPPSITAPSAGRRRFARLEVADCGHRRRIGSAPGLLGGLLLGFAETAWSALFPIEFRDLAIFVLLVFLLIVRPAGLFGLHEALPPKV
jgi:ABC-type branched-subunit amino acid transport system permease subunit